MTVIEAKTILPLPALLHREGLGNHAKKSTRCPFHDDARNSFSVYKNGKGDFRWKCFAGCGHGDEINFLERRRGISRSEATKLFIEMAGSRNGSTPVARKAKPAVFNWERRVAALTDTHLEKLARERAYSREFCAWLKENGLVGIFDGCIAFPVHDVQGIVVAAHVRAKDGSWYYAPRGAKVRPLVIGELTPGDTVHVFESQWDAFGFMDVSGERSGIIITRGAANGGHVAVLIPQRATCFCWTQNDEPGSRWEKSVVPNTKCALRRVKIPTPFKDLNQWTQSGATVDDLVAAMLNAEIATPVLDGANRDEPSQAAEPFPLYCLPSIIEAMAKDVCATERVPERLVGCCALGILSASIGAGLAVRSASNRVTRGNIYVLASAESGSGKSETFRHIAKPFQQFEMDRIERWKEQDRPDAIAKRDLLEVDIKECKKQYAKERDNDINEEVKKFELEIEELEKRLHMPTLTCEDITSEKLADLLSKNDEQLASVSSDALSIVNILLGRYNKLDRTDESLYLKAFSGDPCVVHRMSRDPIFLKSPCLTALWLTQPDKLQSLLDERSLNEGGLIPRILACHTNCGPREIGKNPPSISISVEKAYAGLIFCLLDTYRLAPERFTIAPTSEALRALNDHHDAIVKRRRGELRDVTNYAARWNEQAWRIAVCLHAGTHGGQANEQPVSLETAQRAIVLADWFTAEQLRILNAGRAQRKIERLQRLTELIVQQYNGAATLRSLQRNNGFEPAETRELAAKFPEKLVIERHETGGRPSEIVSLSKR